MTSPHFKCLLLGTLKATLLAMATDNADPSQAWCHHALVQSYVLLHRRRNRGG